MNPSTRQSIRQWLLLTLALSACGQRHPASTIGDAAPSVDEQAVARAAGEQVRRERRAFSVYPTFLERNGEASVSGRNAPGDSRPLVEAFRQGARAQYADTTAYADASDGSAEMGVYRYLFVRDAGTWHFVRRTLVYAT